MRRFSRALIETALTGKSKTVRSRPDKVAHYTRIATLREILKGPRGWTSAWATPVQFLNDRKELVLGLEMLRDAIKAIAPQNSRLITAFDGLNDTEGTLSTDAFQMSFSGNQDELGQWRGYAANGMGCSIVTDTMAVHAVSDVSGWVLYDRTEQQSFAKDVVTGLKGNTDVQTIARVLVAASCFMKHPGFSPEAEYRLIRFVESPPPGTNSPVEFHETGHRIVPHLDYLKHPLAGSAPACLPVRTIRIGPGWQLSDLPPSDFAKHFVVQGITRLLEVRQIVGTDIEPSAIPYDPR